MTRPPDDPVPMSDPGELTLVGGRSLPPALVVGPAGILWLTADGETLTPGRHELGGLARRAPPLVCHKPSLCRRLGIEPFPALDLLELHAFVRPARPVVPTLGGLATALGRPRPADLEAQALLLFEATDQLLAEAGRHEGRQAMALAFTLARAGWLWGAPLLAALGFDGSNAPKTRGLEAWERLPRWEDAAPPPPAGQQPVTPAEARQRLAETLGPGAEDRPQQADFASALCQAFDPRVAQDQPHLVLAEAGTGVGKTLGYLAPASLWAEKNQGTVFLSTFTRNLQQQLDQELERLYPDPGEKSAKVVVRKGRENYLCLLNYADAVGTAMTRPGEILALGLMARWLLATRDGDMVGGDFPGWLPDLVGRERTLGLTDRRGECIYAACPHYGRCFIERSQRKARRARLVVANHALVLAQAAGANDDNLPTTRIVFDEGHHLFEAADNAFAQHLSGRETAELRRWLLGSDGGRNATRLRGLQRRLEDLVLDDAPAAEALEALLLAARALPGEGWRQRLDEGRPQGTTEVFLEAVRQQVLARADRIEDGYDLECDSQPPAPAVLQAAARLDAQLGLLQRPAAELLGRLTAILDEGAETLDADQRRRLEGAIRSLQRRALDPVLGWRAMLASLSGDTPPQFVDWMAVERTEGRAVDLGLYRHWLDPLQPFAEVVVKPAHGLVVTSATLTDAGGEGEQDWARAERRSGAPQAGIAAVRARVPSPFDYAGQTRLFVVTDVAKGRIESLASAYRALILAAGGGALGLFTSIARLRGVQRHLAPALAAEGLELYAQHVDPFDTSTLVEIFRAEENASLLGTDAVRDGVDVPGRSLRLVVFDRVPWPRPDIRHRARRAAFGGKDYDEETVRRRLRQAFGRLIRRADDQGVFVVLDSGLPTRLLTAFPAGVPVARVGLAEAVAETRRFLSPRQ